MQSEMSLIQIVALATVVSMFIFCGICAFLKNNWARQISANGTTIITSTGIFFTFLGIYIGLQGFDIGNIDGGINRLLEGMKTAFLSSVAGLFLALVFRFLRPAFVTENIASNTPATDSSAILRVLAQNNDTTREGFEKLSNLLGGDGDSSVVTQLQRLRTTTQDGLDDLKNQFRSFAENMAENNSAALIEALEAVMRDFNTRINEQFGDNFRQLNEAVGQLLEWQENYRNQIEELTQSFNASKASLEIIETSMRGITTETEKIPSHLEALQEIQTQLEQQIVNLTEAYGSFAQMKQDAQEAFPAIQQGLTNFSTHLTQELENNFEILRQRFSQFADELASETRDSFQTIQQRMSAFTDDINQNTQNSFDTIKEAVDLHINGLNESKNAVESITSAVEETVQQSTQAVSHSSQLLENGQLLVNETATGLRNVLENHNARVETMVEAQDEKYRELVDTTTDRIVVTTDGIASNFDEILGNLSSQLNEEATNAFESIKNNMENQLRAIKEIGDAIQAASEQNTIISENAANMGTQIANDLSTTTQALNEQMVQIIENVKNEFESLATQSAQNMQRALEESTRGLPEKIKQLDSDMQQEVTRVIEIMGRHLTTITTEFVRIYGNAPRQQHMNEDQNLG